MRLIQSGDIPSGTQLMDNWNVLYRQIGLSDIETLIDRGVTFTADGGQFAEAYIDTDGRNNSVDTTNTTGQFDTDKWFYSDEPYGTGTESLVSSTSAVAAAEKDLVISDDGLKMYALDRSTEIVYEYDLSTAYQSSTAVASGTTLDLSSKDSNVQGFTISPNGLYLYMIGGTNLKWYQYTLSSAWDLSTASYTAEVAQPIAAAFSMAIGNSGSSLYIVRYATSATMSEYTMTTPYDITTVTATNTYATGASNPTAVGFSLDGTIMYTGHLNAVTRVHDLSTAWDISSASYSDDLTGNSYQGFCISQNGYHYYLDKNSSTDLAHYSFPSGGEIAHTIPSGTFGSTLSSAFATFKAEDWESGADVQFKLRTTDPSTVNQNSFVEIEATSINETELSINNCIVIPKSAGVWILGSTTTGDDEVARSEVYQTLFYGSNGSNPKITSAITGLTTLKTSVARDVGKQSHYAQISTVSNSTGGYKGTFANTSTNDDCSTWSYIETDGSLLTMSWELPEATTLNTRTSSGTSDELGTDLSADELNNPADCELSVSLNTNYRTGYARALILCEGDITWAENGTLGSSSNTDFLTDYGVPAFTTGATLPGAQEETGYLATNEIVSFTQLNGQPRTVVYKLIPKTTSPTVGYPSINGVALYGDRPA